MLFPVHFPQLPAISGLLVWWRTPPRSTEQWIWWWWWWWKRGWPRSKTLKFHGVSVWISGRWDQMGPPHRRLLGFLLWLTLGTADGFFLSLQRKSGDRTSMNFPSAGLRMIYHDHSWSITCKPSSIYVATSLVTSLTLSQVLNSFAARTLFSLVRGGWWRKTCSIATDGQLWTQDLHMLFL